MPFLLTKSQKQANKSSFQARLKINLANFFSCPYHSCFVDKKVIKSIGKSNRNQLFWLKDAKKILTGFWFNAKNEGVSNYGPIARAKEKKKKSARYWTTFHDSKTLIYSFKLLYFHSWLLTFPFVSIVSNSSTLA